MGFWKQVLYRYAASLLQAVGGLLILAGLAGLVLAGMAWHQGPSLFALAPEPVLWLGLILLLLGLGLAWSGIRLLRLVRRKTQAP